MRVYYRTCGPCNIQINASQESSVSSAERLTLQYELTMKDERGIRDAINETTEHNNTKLLEGQNGVQESLGEGGEITPGVGGLE